MLQYIRIYTYLNPSAGFGIPQFEERYKDNSTPRLDEVRQPPDRPVLNRANRRSSEVSLQRGSLLFSPLPTESQFPTGVAAPR